MYDINTKVVTQNNKMAYIFIGGGILFLIVLLGIFIFQTTRKNSLDSQVISTEVTISSHEDSEGDTVYSPVYTYVVDGKTYTCKSNSSSSINPDTKNEPVYYDSKNPEKCMTTYETATNWIWLVACILPLILIVIGVIFIVKSKDALKRIAILNKSGKLVKNIPYKIEDTNTAVNGVQGIRIVIDYALPNGTMVTLKSDPRYDGMTSDDDGMVDLVIDENNPDIHYIDFEINRISGNRPEDFFKDPYDMSQNQQPAPEPTPEPTPQPESQPTVPPANQI
jgi:uncharacterized integral membrane protein